MKSRTEIISNICEDFVSKYEANLAKFESKDKQNITSIYCKIAKYVIDKHEDEYWDKVVYIYEKKILKIYLSKVQNFFLLNYFKQDYLILNFRKFYTIDEFNNLGEQQFLSESENKQIKRILLSYLQKKKWELYFEDKSNENLSESEKNEDGINNKTSNKEFTTARQVLAIHYLLKYSKIGQFNAVDQSNVARFIHFLTNKNYDNIYKLVLSPLKQNDNAMKKDLKFIKTYFENLGAKEIVKMIDNEISFEKEY